MDASAIWLLSSLGFLVVAIAVRALGWNPAKFRARRGSPPLRFDESRRGLGVRRPPGESRGPPTRPLFYVDGRGRLPRFSFTPPKDLTSETSSKRDLHHR
jgi:hypothetical protein